MSMEGRTVLVTGATDGLGKRLAMRLAAEGAEVLLHGRDPDKGAAVLAEIQDETGNPRLAFHAADLASLDEVRDLARAVTAAHPRLHVLVNNAGIGLFGDDRRRESRDGHELQFAVNYLSHFLLTQLLLPTLRASTPARIVNVSSIGQAPLDFDDLMLERAYTGTQGYCQSKLAQVMFTLDLSERLKGTGVTVTALHPATFMDTNMVSGAGLAPRSTVAEGAEALYRLVASPEVEGDTGVFYNQLSLGRANDQAYDAGARRELWRRSLRLAGAPIEAA